MGILWKKQKGNAWNQNTVTEIKNAFVRLISRLGMAKERTIKLEDMTIHASETKKAKRTKTKLK